ncbi:TlpA family protein disulfide reductase [Hyunsoonleella flava]|uniref:TlpA family protein disulfide reductase n=1 Tax=Hyunsoonleella flava TaxID=2527939 RepID=A0A4Q9FEA1_9FLAO|nr:TlpA disulfide reductase family protein [Hyunsoonleella flava]TBN04691.1 TlpA family protein disulfide reductase [Hyunsoonleella flava]
MKITKQHIKNLIFLGVAALFIIPQTRKPIQVLVNRGLALFSPSTIEASKQQHIGEIDWVLIDINGEGLNFRDTKGKVVLINFWATWCPPCIAEMPSMDKLYADYSNKIEFLFVSDEKQEVIKKFLNKNEYNFNVYKPVTKYPEVFDVGGIPRTFLIDTNGNIIIDKTGAANWNSETVRETIDKLLVAETN